MPFIILHLFRSLNRNLLFSENSFYKRIICGISTSFLFNLFLQAMDYLQKGMHRQFQSYTSLFLSSLSILSPIHCGKRHLYPHADMCVPQNNLAVPVLDLSLSIRSHSHSDTV